MKTALCYFSGTGNTLFAAQTLASQLGDCDFFRVYDVLRDPHLLESYPRVGFLFPVYGCGLPHIIRELIPAIGAELEGKDYFAVITAGAMPCDVPKQFLDLMSENGLYLRYVTTVDMPDNYTVTFTAPNDRMIELAMRTAERKLAVIAADIQNNVTRQPRFGFKGFSAFNRLFLSDGISRDENYILTAACDGCGLCAKLCPVDNIRMENGKPVFLHRCEFCLGCFNRCPKGAINYGRKTIRKKRYVNPKVRFFEEAPDAERPTLVVLAAGMGSRYGGLKQIDPVGPNGEIILDYSLYDAALAGFGKVVFVIRPDIADAFEASIGARARRHMEVDYAFQRLDALPDEYAPPEGRMKPWGTGHAVLCAREQVNTPFAVINADDFYGRDCFMRLASFLRSTSAGSYAMAGYRLENTLSEGGAVSRGVCSVAHGRLQTVREHTGIARSPFGLIEGNDGTRTVSLAPDTVVSMNAWGFPAEVFDDLARGFSDFLAKPEGDPLKREYYLPYFVDQQIAEKRASVSVLETDAKWFGVTYREDRDGVSAALRALHEESVYPPLA